MYNSSMFQKNKDSSFFYKNNLNRSYYFPFLFPNKTKKSDVTELDRVLSDVTLSYLRWCGKGNQWFCTNSMTELLGAPTHHITLWFLHTIMPTSLSLNRCQPTEQGCDVHHWLLAQFRPSLKAHSNELLTITTAQIKLVKSEDGCLTAILGMIVL